MNSTVARSIFCRAHVEGLTVTFTSDTRFLRFRPVATHSASAYLVQLTGVEHNKTGQRIELYPHAEPQPGASHHLVYTAELPRLRAGSYHASVRPLQLDGFLDDLPCVREPERCSDGTDPHWEAAAASNARCQQQRVCVSEPSYVPASLEFRVGAREASSGDTSSLRPCTLLPTGALLSGLWRGGEWAPYGCSRARAGGHGGAAVARLLRGAGFRRVVFVGDSTTIHFCQSLSRRLCGDDGSCVVADGGGSPGRRAQRQNHLSFVILPLGSAETAMARLNVTCLFMSPAEARARLYNDSSAPSGPAARGDGMLLPLDLIMLNRAQHMAMHGDTPDAQAAYWRAEMPRWLELTPPPRLGLFSAMSPAEWVMRGGVAWSSRYCYLSRALLRAYALNEARLAARHGAWLFDAHSATEAAPWLHPPNDAVHLDPRGNQLLVDLFLEQLASTLQ